MIEIHPNWHPIFVHFTVAPLILAVALHLADPLLHEGKLKEQWRVVARWNLWFGTVFAVATAVAGWDAYNSVAHDAPSHAAMTDHRNWALATLLAFLGLGAWSMSDAARARKPGPLFLGALLFGGLLLASTAWRGGELVYRHGLGVISLPEQGGEGHDHEHAVGEMHAPHGTAPATGTLPRESSGADRDAATSGPAAAGAPAAAKPARPRTHRHDDGHNHEHKN